MSAQLRMFVHHHDVAEMLGAPQKADGPLRPRDRSVIDELGQHARYFDHRPDARQIVSAAAVAVIVVTLSPILQAATDRCRGPWR